MAEGDRRRTQGDAFGTPRRSCRESAPTNLSTRHPAQATTSPHWSPTSWRRATAPPPSATAKHRHPGATRPISL